MVAISLHFKPEDVASFRNQMNRAVRQLRKTPREAVRWATVIFLTSIRASTKQSRKARKVKELKNGRVEITGYFFDRTKGEKVESKRTYYRHSFAGDINRAAKIHYSGLAKKSWGWMMQDLFKRSAGAGIFKRVRDVSEATQSGRDWDYKIALTNKLDYAEKAFRTTGRTSIDTAVRRASSGLEKRINRILER